MVQVSPLLQAKIKQHKLSLNQHINNNTSFKSSDSNSKSDKFLSDNKAKKSSVKKNILTALAVLALATLSAFVFKDRIKPIFKKMSSIKFKKIKTKKFTGEVKRKLKNGDELVLEYSKGSLIKSTRTGKLNIVKAYEYILDSDNKPHVSVVKQTIGNTTKEINIKQIKNSVNASCEGFKKLFSVSTADMTADELESFAKSFKFLNKKQKEFLSNVIIAKKALESNVQNISSPESTLKLVNKSSEHGKYKKLKLIKSKKAVLKPIKTPCPVQVTGIDLNKSGTTVFQSEQKNKNYTRKVPVFALGQKILNTCTALYIISL